MPIRIGNYEDICTRINISYDAKAKIYFKSLEEEGHTERSICFAIYKGGKKLIGMPKDKLFWTEFLKIIRKWSWAKDDIRWVHYNAKKKRQEDARNKQAEIKSKKITTSNAWGPITGFIYFIQGESGGPIKIGYTTDIYQRLKNLQSGHTDVLKLLLMVPGNFEYEHGLQDYFKECRLNGEWFKPEPQLLQYIEKELARANK